MIPGSGQACYLFVNKSKRVLKHLLNVLRAPLLLLTKCSAGCLLCASDPRGDEAPPVQPSVHLHHPGCLYGDRGRRRLRSLSGEIPGAAVQPDHHLSQPAPRSASAALSLTLVLSGCGKPGLCLMMLSAGMTAIPCACLGIFMGGLLVKKLNLSALGAIRMAMLVNLISTACYVSFLFLGCDTGPVAGVTISYDNR